VCVCVLLGSFRGTGAFYFKIENRRDIFNTTLQTRINAHKQSSAINGSLNMNIIYFIHIATDVTQSTIMQLELIWLNRIKNSN